MKYLINQDTLDSLGDAVRKISNTTNKMNMNECIDKINNLNTSNNNLICPQLTITSSSNDVDVDNVCYPLSDGLYQWDWSAGRQELILTNIPCNMPIFIEAYGSFEPTIKSSTNIKVLCNHECRYYIIECITDSNALIDFYDND